MTGEDLKRAHEAAGLSQRDLAKRADVSQAAVSRLEAGATTERSVVLALREELKKRINASLEADQLDHEAVAALGRLTNHAGVYHGVYEEANHG
jgi:predicted transcriptional regulator